VETIDNLIVGKPDANPSMSAHSPGVRQGNQRKSLIREPGTKQVSPMFAKATVRRSTGINAKARQPIDPRMPNLTPP